VSVCSSSGGAQAPTIPSRKISETITCGGVASRRLTPRVTSLRLVLDSNAWLDRLVFRDPATAPIRAAHASGKALIFIGLPCLDELTRVLAYPPGRNTLDAPARAAVLAERRRIAGWKLAPARRRPRSGFPPGAPRTTGSSSRSRKQAAPTC